MLGFFALAVRNLSRNKRRTLITGLAIVVGAMAMVFMSGFLNGLKASVVEPAVLGRSAAIQVHKKGYIGSNDPLKMNMPDDPKIVEKIKAVPGVTGVAPRINFEGLANNGLEATMFMATGIKPELEYQVCPKRKMRILEGGKPIEAGAYGAALVGHALADTLDAKQGGTLILQSAGPGVGANAIDIEINGFLPVRWAMESKRLTTVSLDFAWDLLRMHGKITEYGVGVENLEDVDAVAKRVRATLGDEYEVTTWKQVETFSRDYLNMLTVVMSIVILTLYFLVATGITNTMVMSVHERVREIGTMIALGLKRSQVRTLFLAEAISLGLGAAIIGSAFGLGMVRMMARKGVLFKPPGGDPIIITPFIGGNQIFTIILFAVIGTALAGLYPAWKASRMRPAEALRAT